MPIANINEADLWYDVLGQGEPLLLHHGYTASRVNWMPVAERLKDRYQIILMECRGTGESQHTQSGYEIAQYALDVVGLLDHLALERVAFAGHSMGGGIGFQLGVHHSDRLTKLILKAAIPSGGIGPYSQDLLDQQLAARARGDRAFFLNRYHQGRTLAELEDDDWFEDRVNHLMTVSDGHIAGGLETMSRPQPYGAIGRSDHPNAGHRRLWGRPTECQFEGLSALAKCGSGRVVTGWS